MDTTSARAKDGRLTLDLITEWFALLGPQTFSNRADFFAHVADNVTWTICNPLPDHTPSILAGTYDKAGIQALFAQVSDVMAEPMGLVISPSREPLVAAGGRRALVELQAMNSAGEPPATVKGFKYDLRYAWVLEVNEVPEIISVHAYIDSALVNKALS